jgi:hypothetical protein
MGHLTGPDKTHDRPSNDRATCASYRRPDDTVGVSATVERVALGILGLSIAVLAADSALEAHDGVELVWLPVGIVGLASFFASVKGRCRPFTRMARLLRLPPMA